MGWLDLPRLPSRNSWARAAMERTQTPQPHFLAHVRIGDDTNRMAATTQQARRGQHGAEIAWAAPRGRQKVE